VTFDAYGQTTISIYSDRSDALIVGASKLDRVLALCEHTKTTSLTKMNAC